MLLLLLFLLSVPFSLFVLGVYFCVCASDILPCCDVKAEKSSGLI